MSHLYVTCLIHMSHVSFIRPMTRRYATRLGVVPSRNRKTQHLEHRTWSNIESLVWSKLNPEKISNKCDDFVTSSQKCLFDCLFDKWIRNRKFVKKTNYVTMWRNYHIWISSRKMECFWEELKRKNSQSRQITWRCDEIITFEQVPEKCEVV